MKLLIEEYSRGYMLLREAIDGLSNEELHFRPAPNKWSIHQILIHVADSELVATQRLKKVLAEKEPLLTTWNQDDWANGLEYEKLDREQHLILFQLLRTNMLPVLANLTAEQCERVGVYHDAGRFTFKQLLEFRIQHIRDHLAQIERVRDAYNQLKVNKKANLETK